MNRVRYISMFSAPQPAPTYYVERCGGLAVHQPVHPRKTTP